MESYMEKYDEWLNNPVIDEESKTYIQKKKL